ncbi:uncharacterized protein A4U43_C01F17160 [Asparagus officinalis]|uniref:Uncharacterized protein n=1 Tax=Asparagus officinalis TaxID=4686 RepID=A0A5P1FQM0_ASPOF|nr:uncharacterized protein A4U43_C01F17160 [Asparagus officinalis]
MLPTKVKLRNGDISAEGANKVEAVGAQEDTEFEVDASDDPMSGLEVRENITVAHSFEENDIIESQISGDSQAEIVDPGMQVPVSAPVHVSDLEHVNPQGDVSSHSYTRFAHTLEGETNTSEEKSVVMPDVNRAPKDEVKMQIGHVSKGEKTHNSSSEKAMTETTDEQENGSKSGDEGGSSSVSNQNEHVEFSENKENSIVEEVRCQGNSASKRGSLKNLKR